MNRGWREAFQALGFLILLSVLLFALFGYVPMRASLEYEHHSSAQDYYDLNTSDLLGVCVLAYLSKDPTPYTFQAEGCLSWEVTGVPVYGRDPVGTLRIRKPIYYYKP